MIPPEFQKYIRSKEFKELLAKYQQFLNTREGGFFDADDVLDIAEYYHLNGDDDGAMVAARHCLDLYPDNDKAKVFIARTYITAGDIPRADQVLLTIPTDNLLDTVYLRAELLICHQKEVDAEKYLRDYYSNMDVATDVIEEEEEDEKYDAYVNFPIDIALLYCDYQFWELAEGWISLVEDKDLIASGDYLEVRAKILTATERYSEAISYWNKYIDINAYTPLAWVQLSQCQYHEGNCYEALQSAQYAEAIDANIPESYLAQGNCLFALGRSQEALDKFDKFLSICPEDAQGELLTASVLFSMERYEEAKVHIEIALEKIIPGVAPESPDDIIYPDFMCIEVLKQAAYIDCALGNMQESLYYADKLMLYGMSEQRSKLLRAGIFIESGRAQEGLSLFSQVLVESNHDPEMYISVGCMLVDSCFFEMGYSFLSQTLNILEESGTPSKVGYDRHAYAALMTNHYEEFLSSLKTSVKNQPSDTATIFSSMFPENMPVSEYVEYARKNTIKRPS